MEQWKQKTWFQAADGTKGSNALIAKEAGVTSGTVNNVFNRPEKVIPETTKRVLEAVEKLGYTYNVMPTMKMCTICKTVKPFEDFYTNGIAQNRYNKNIRYRTSLCKDCSSKKNKKYHTENRPKLTAQQLVSHRRRKYGINEEEYQAMVLSQNNICAICNKPSDRTLHVDHDHITGKIRGLLCNSCNTGIGLFKEDVDSLANAIKYLNAHAELG